MPVISVDPDSLMEMTDSDELELLNDLPKIGVEIERMEDEGWDLEVSPDRCDMLSVEGIARTFNGFKGKKTGLPQYKVIEDDDQIVTEVELSVQEVRPYIVTAVVKDIKLTDALLKSLMDVQEKLHLTLGRGRERVAIGVHDLAPIKPPLVYKAVKPDDISFEPLEKMHEMTLREILEEHEKGKEYAHILEGKEKYPIILDSEDNVLSFPPVINGTYTQVDPETTDLFIDMTGTDMKTLGYTLNILVTMLADRGGDIHQTSVRYGNEEKYYPDLEPGSITISFEETRELIGVDLEESEVVDILSRSRLDSSIDGDEIEVTYPAYRHDIMHPWDIIEDIAYGYDFDNFAGEMPKEVTLGKSLPVNRVIEAIKELMVGYGFKEVVNSVLSDEESQFEKMRLPVDDDVSLVENPVTEDQGCLRTWVLPSLMNNLKNNRNKPLPQSIFEVGEVVNRSVQRTQFCAVVTHSEAGFTEVKSKVEGLAKGLGLTTEIKEKNHDSFIRGRCASIDVSDEEIGFFGEVHPEVISNFTLENPVIALLMDIDKIADIKNM
ncbi:MAG: phenylalanine--tRNA ligase subunit beta [Thermoplasmatota archaeon]